MPVTAPLRAFLARHRRKAAALTALAACVALSSLVRRWQASQVDRATWRRPCTYRDAGRPRARLARMIEAIVARCPELQRPSYLPPWFLASTWLNVAAFISKAKLGVLSFVADGASADAETGELLAREYMEGDEDSGRLASPRARGRCPTPHRCASSFRPWLGPALVTRTTSSRRRRGGAHAAEQARTFRGPPPGRAQEQGRRVLEFDRRPGRCGRTDGVGDAALSRGPFVGMVGLSAGSGLLVNYLGTRGVRSPVQAGCCVPHTT